MIELIRLLHILVCIHVYTFSKHCFARDFGAVAAAFCGCQTHKLLLGPIRGVHQYVRCFLCTGMALLRPVCDDLRLVDFESPQTGTGYSERSSHSMKPHFRYCLVQACGWTGSCPEPGCADKCVPYLMPSNREFGKLVTMSSLSAMQCPLLAGVVHLMSEAANDVQGSRRKLQSMVCSFQPLRHATRFAQYDSATSNVSYLSFVKGADRVQDIQKRVQAAAHWLSRNTASFAVQQRELATIEQSKETLFTRHLSEASDGTDAGSTPGVEATSATSDDTAIEEAVANATPAITAIASGASLVCTPLQCKSSCMCCCMPVKCCRKSMCSKVDEAHSKGAY